MINLNRYVLYDYTVRLSTVIGINYGIYTCPNNCPRENVMSGLYGGAAGAALGFLSPVIACVGIVSIPALIIKEINKH